MNPTVQLIEEMTDRALGRTESTILLSAATERATMHTHLAAMDSNASVAQMPTPPGRSRFLKRVVLKLGRFVFVRQESTNHAIVGAFHALLGELDATRLELEHERRRSIAAIAAFDQRFVERAQYERDQYNAAMQRLNDLALLVADLQQVSERYKDHIQGSEALTQVVEQQSQVVEQQVKRLADLNANLVVETTRRQVLERELSSVKRRQSHPAAEPARASDDDSSDLPQFDLAELYERFEATFRPPGTDLTQRFEHYVPDVSHLRSGQLPVLDVGTGRGDFLTVLTRAGIPCKGIDLNPAAVAAAQKAGLDVVHADAFAYLESIAPESLGAVTAFHVVEHMSRADLLRFVDQVVRALVPGGIVILETPNPTNLVVGASSFYHDPTHERPVTPDYLGFLVQDRGLVHVETRFLHPLPEYDLVAPIEDVLGGRSLQLLLDDVRWALKGPQDYAVIARRPSAE